MDKFLQAKLMPIAIKLGNNKGLVAIRDGITLAVPLLLIGSLFMVIASFPVPGWEAYLTKIGVSTYLWKGVDSSFGLIGLVASFGIAYYMSRQYKVDGIPSGIISLAAFITVTPFLATKTGNGVPTAFLASQGLFVAIILGLVNGYIYQWFINHNVQIKMPDGVPIVLNILLLFPFILAPIANLIVAWSSMASGLVPLTYTDPGWTTPPIISGLLATGSFKASILQAVLIVIDILIYIPFVITIEKRFKAEENQ